MGRDKPKKFNKMNHQQKQVFLEKGLRDLGSSAVYHPDFQGRGSASHGMIDLEKTQDKFEKLSRNDFDYRTSAQHMDGIKGDASASDFVNYQRSAHKLHKKAGNGGKYSSISDITGVTNNLVNDAQRLLRDKIDALSANDDEQTNTSITPDVTEEPYEPSPELLKHQAVVADWEEGYGAGGNLSPYKSNFQDMAFNPEEANPYRPTTNVNEFAQQYAANYTDGIKDIFKFKPTIA